MYVVFLRDCLPLVYFLEMRIALCTTSASGYSRTQENKGTQVKRVGRADFLTIDNALVKHARFEVAVRTVTGRHVKRG